ncbi:putative bifunctional diguanylate cyclase/phosphodiesterase [uncultured Sphingomonas sp.]|uniref:putative bifunctional diguanylate cyclase/phosphodiesterase n=1 Tax=uncultured Sphingomonas sp. TaxID=158754 RepID=UPI0035C9476B
MDQADPLAGDPLAGDLPWDEAALFLLSFGERGELSAIAAAAGWRVVAARRGEGAVRRFLTSGATIALLDTRGALEEGLAQAGALGEAARTRGGALLVLVSSGDVASLAPLYSAGATHFLVSPFGETELVHALRFAARHVSRIGGTTAPRRELDPLGWRYHRGTRRLRLTPALARRMTQDEDIPAAVALRTMPRSDRDNAIAAIRRVGSGGATAFAHDVAGQGRLVHHIQAIAGDPWIYGLIEELGMAPDAAATTGVSMTEVDDVIAARDRIDRRLRRGLPATAVIAALSRFDLVNTSYGRNAGDTLIGAALRRVETCARSTLGKRHALARLRGPEFLVACDDADAAEDFARTLSEVLARPFAIESALVSVGARIGVATSQPGEDVAMLMRRAGDALEEARASDGATIHIAGGLATSGASLDVLATDLRRAIEGGEIAVLFQPQVAIGSGRITGVEALARWEHPRFGAIGAEALFAAADRADLGLALSDHVQRLALEGAAAWPASLGGLRLAVNVTAADIAHPGFVDMFLDRVDGSGFGRARLTAEITESGLIDDLGAAATLLASLRGAGCRIAIDDFGTGYSSLAYLKALPLDYLKIDKKLAQDIAGNPRDRIVVRGVIEMARSLGLSVIAEGVETDEQLDLLAREGCQYYQGFLCSEPVDAVRLAELIERQQAD